MRGKILFPFIITLAFCLPAFPLAVQDFRVENTEIGRFQKFQASFDLDWQFDNPFNPREIDIRVIITAPDGSVASAFGYYTQDFHLQESDVPFEKRDKKIIWRLREYIPISKGYWQFRYAPLLLGEHQYHLEINSRAGNIRYPESGEMSFNCITSDSHGFLQVDSRNPRYLAFSDGSSFFGVGFNAVNIMGACDQGMVRFFDIARKSAEFGATISQIDICQGDYLEWSRVDKRGFPYYSDYEGLGRYNLEVASQIDAALELSQQLGIYLRFSFFHWTDFQPEYFFPENTPGFRENPYFFRLGGPCRRPIEFFSDPAAFRFQEQMFRYIIARWGYSANIICWELWNEVDNVFEYDERPVLEWHRKAVNALRRLDSRHLITTSFSRRDNGTAFFRKIDFDITTFHCYTSFALEEYAFNTLKNMKREIELLEPLKKPILPGEFGFIGGEGFGADMNLPDDAQGIHLHNQLWASLMMGAACGAMHWHWEKYLDKYNLYYRLRGIAQFVKGEDFSGFQSVRDANLTITAPPKQIRYLYVDRPSREGKRRGETPRPTFRYETLPQAGALGLVGNDKVLIWVFDRGNNFISGNPSPSIEGTTLLVKNMNDGEAEIQYWDTIEGKIISSASGQISGGRIELEIPPFTGDIALKIIRK